MTDFSAIFTWSMGLLLGASMVLLAANYERSQAIKAGVMVVDGQAYVLLPASRRGLE